MSSATPTKPSHAQRHDVETKVTPYERASGMLIALLILVGFLVIMLFFVWLTKMMSGRLRAVPVSIIEEFAGREENALGAARDLDEPGVEELADVIEPQLFDSLAAVTDAVSSQVATLESFEGNAEKLGTGSSLGDNRVAGSDGEGDGETIPRWERWEVRLVTNSQEDYAKQLDYFRIELGAVGSSEVVEYAMNFTREKPTKRLASPEDEQRLYFSYTQKTAILKEWDRQLLQKAGISTAGRFWLQFFPKEVENGQLAVLEKKKAGRRTIKEIQKTVFGVKKIKNGYEFFVLDQKYRRI